MITELAPIWRQDGAGAGTGGIYTFTSVGVGTSAQTSFFEVYGPSKFRTGVVTFTNSGDTDIVRITDGGFNVISGITTIGGALDCNGNLDVDGTDHDIVGTIALDNVQVSAGATIEGNLTLTGSGSTSSIAGALQLTNVNVSGVHTSGFAVVTNDLTVNGNMTVNGTTTTLDTNLQEVDLINVQVPTVQLLRSVLLNLVLVQSLLPMMEQQKYSELMMVVMLVSELIVQELFLECQNICHSHQLPQIMQ